MVNYKHGDLEISPPLGAQFVLLYHACKATRRGLGENCVKQ